MNLIIIYYYQFQQDLLETGLHQDILDQILQIIRLYKKDIIRIEFKIDDKNTNQNLKIKVNENLPDRNENVSFIKDSYLAI